MYDVLAVAVVVLYDVASYDYYTFSDFLNISLQYIYMYSRVATFPWNTSLSGKKLLLLPLWAGLCVSLFILDVGVNNQEMLLIRPILIKPCCGLSFWKQRDFEFYWDEPLYKIWSWQLHVLPSELCWLIFSAKWQWGHICVSLVS